MFVNLLTLGYVAWMRSVQHAVHELIYFFYNNHELVYLNSRVMLCGKKNKIDTTFTIKVRRYDNASEV